MSNEYYNTSGGPGNGAFLSSAQIRGEYDLIEEAFDKLPSVDDINSGATNSVTVTGTVNNYNATLPNIDGYAGFQIYVLRMNITNTGPSTLNINGLGTRAIVRHDNTALQAGDLMAGRIYIFVYDDVLGKVVLLSVMSTGSSESNPTFNDIITNTINNLGALLTGYLREKTVELEINEDDEILLDWTGYAYHNWTNTREHTVKHLNYPTIALGYAQSILLTIRDASDFTIFYSDDTYTRERPFADIGQTVGDKIKILASCCEANLIFQKTVFNIQAIV